MEHPIEHPNEEESLNGGVLQRGDPKFPLLQDLYPENRPEVKGLFWDTKFEGKMTDRTNPPSSSLILSLLLGVLIVFIAIQQIVGGPRNIIILVTLAIAPYIVGMFFLDIRSRRDVDESSKEVPFQFNAILGPGIVSLAIASCVFSTPIEDRVWIIGGKTSGSEGTIFAIPLINRAISIPKEQEITLDVDGKTLDNAKIYSHIRIKVTCCTDNPETIIETYGGGLKIDPEIATRNFLTVIFDESFKRCLANVKESDIRSAYVAMTKDITAKTIGEQFGLVWNGRFTVLN